MSRIFIKWAVMISLGWLCIWGQHAESAPIGYSANTVVDTRTARPATITLIGPSTVIAGDIATYAVILTHSDGTQEDVSSRAAIKFVGAVPAGAQIDGTMLATAHGFDNVQATLRATYTYSDGQLASSDTAITINGENGLLAKIAERQSAPKVVSTGPNAWELSAEVTAYGQYGTVAQLVCVWKLDGVTINGATGNRLTSVPVTGNPGTRLLSVQVTDTQNQTASASRLVAFNKPPLPQEPRIRQPAADPINGTMLDDNGQPFVFTSQRIPNGLVIITHGLRSSGTEDWIQSMHLSVVSRMVQEGKSIPNVAIYDWEDMAQPLPPVDYDAVSYRSYLLRTLQKASLLTIDGLTMLGDLMLIRDKAVAQGKALADWIRDNVAANNIDPNAPIHLIGHSAGGFVMGECAFLLKTRGIIDGRVQVTSLDTPCFKEADTRIIQTAKAGGYNCFAERYYSNRGLGIHSYSLLNPSLIASGGGYYERGLSGGPFFILSAHAWVHDWYDDDTTSAYGIKESDGFYYSPFMNNGFHGQSPGLLAMAQSGIAVGTLGMTNQALSGFTSFGDVQFTGGVYSVTEQLNAGLIMAMTNPVGSQQVSFKYRFASAGDGDFMVVYWGTNSMPLFIGNDLEIARTDFVEGEAYLDMYAGETNQLIFMLVSRGDANAVLEIKDIVLHISDDPDHDGLTTEQELSLGTNPLVRDTDGDGIIDGDEVNIYLTNPLLSDSDLDGITDGMEINAGTNPNDPMSVFKITGQSTVGYNQADLQWSGPTDRLYRVNQANAMDADTYRTLVNNYPSNHFMAVGQAGGATNAHGIYWIELDDVP